MNEFKPAEQLDKCILDNHNNICIIEAFMGDGWYPTKQQLVDMINNYFVVCEENRKLKHLVDNTITQKYDIEGE